MGVWAKTFVKNDKTQKKCLTKLRYGATMPTSKQTDNFEERQKASMKKLSNAMMMMYMCMCRMCMFRRAHFGQKLSETCLTA